MFSKTKRKQEQELRQACVQANVSLDAICSIVQAHPQAVKAADSNGCLPLHLACQYGASLNVVEFLVSSWPDAVQQTDLNGCLPLHWACFGSSSLGVVQYLLSSYPGGVSSKTNQGEVPLHFASHAGRLHIIECLYQHYPDAVSVATKFGELPIHSMCHGSQVSLEAMQFLVKRCRKAVTTVNMRNELPLHLVCECNKASIEVLDWLLKQAPETVKSATIDEDLPLHLACANGASLSIVQLLAEKFPQAVCIQNYEGMLPLHLVCSTSHAQLDVVQYLVKQYPNGVKIKADNGKLAVECAIESHAPLVVIQYLSQLSPIAFSNSSTVPLSEINISEQLLVACSELPPSMDKVHPLVQASPDAVKAIDENGELPLHLACWNRAPLDVIDVLVKAWPDSVYQKDSRGWIPLHWACANLAPLEVVEYLVQVWPDSLVATNNYASLPLHLACVNQTDANVIQFLVKSRPETLQAENDMGELPVHKACESSAPCLPIVEFLVSHWKDSIKHMNDMGELPLHLACNEEGHLDVVQYLVTEWPSSVMESTHGGELPLHFACEHRAPLDVIVFLVEQWPDSLKTRTKDGDLPIHVACANESSLEVIQYLVRTWPESVTAEDSEGRTPIEVARHPSAFHRLKPEVVMWLAAVDVKKLRLVPETETTPVEKSVSRRRSSGQRTFEKERSNLRQVIVGKCNTPVSVHTKYVKSIMKWQLVLGTGNFGVVIQGTDDVLAQDFAIKAIDQESLLGVSKDVFEQAKKKFKEEQQALLHVRHPNIALLYAYALSSHHRRGHYLLYELAEKGSLQAFWNSELARERLSSFPQRAQIALEAFIGLRFLHIGNKTVRPSFHHDIKSANIVLKHDMTAQLIDCGMGAFAPSNEGREIRTSAGVSGTLGYICPKFCNGLIPFNASCDIFSFGVVLAELWSGRLQNHIDDSGQRCNFYDEYIDADKPRNMEEDLDTAFGINNTKNLSSCMIEFKDLALDCMASSPTKRPDGIEVLNCLEKIWQASKQQSSTCLDDDLWSLNESLQSIAEAPSTGDDSICRLCRTYAVEVGFEECPLCLALQRQRLLVEHAIPQELDAKYTAMKKFAALRPESLHEFQDARKQQTLVEPLVSIRDFRLNHSLPRLFLLLPADYSTHDKLPSAWLQSLTPISFYLYFICQDALELVDPPVRVMASRVWIQQIALLLGVSLSVLKKCHHKKLLKVASIDMASEDFAISHQEVSQMLQEVKDILRDDANALKTLARVIHGSKLSDEDVELLNGSAYELLAERAQQDYGWRRNMQPVRKQFHTEISWVSSRIAENPQNDYEVIDT